MSSWTVFCCGHPQLDQGEIEMNAGASGEMPSSGAFMNSSEFVDTLVSAATKGEKKGDVSINLELIETILLYDEDTNTTSPQVGRAEGRKGTGFIRKDQVAQAVSKVHIVDGSGGSEETLPHDGRVKARKGTGAVSKEKLLEILDNISDDEEEEQGGATTVKVQVQEVQQQASITSEPLPPRSPGSPTKVLPSSSDRCKTRKGTGFVSKGMLKKVLAALGEEEE